MLVGVKDEEQCVEGVTSLIGEWEKKPLAPPGYTFENRAGARVRAIIVLGLERERHIAIIQ